MRPRRRARTYRKGLPGFGGRTSRKTWSPRWRATRHRGCGARPAPGGSPRSARGPTSPSACTAGPRPPRTCRTGPRWIPTRGTRDQDVGHPFSPAGPTLADKLVLRAGVVRPRRCGHPLGSAQPRARPALGGGAAPAAGSPRLLLTLNPPPPRPRRRAAAAEPHPPQPAQLPRRANAALGSLPPGMLDVAVARARAELGGVR